MKNLTPIENWNDETVNSIFTAYLDELSQAKRDTCIVKYLSVNEKRNFLISEQKKFDKSLK